MRRLRLALLLVLLLPAVVDAQTVRVLTTETTPVHVTVPDDGTSTHRLISAASTNGTNVKSEQGVVYGVLCTNTNAADRWLKVYDKATTPTVGTDAPKLTIRCMKDGGISPNLPVDGVAFASGIGIGTTTGVADSDTGAVAANEIVVHIFYR